MIEQEKKKNSITIPTFESKLDIISNILRDNSTLGMILIDVQSLEKIQTQHNDVLNYSLITTFKDFFATFKGTQVRNEDIMTLNIKGGNSYYIFLARPRIKKFFEIDDYENLSQRLQYEIDNNLFTNIFPLIKKTFSVKVGYSVCFYNPDVNITNILEILIKTAQSISTYREIKEEMRKKELFYRLIIEENATILYQPIINLNTHKIIGYESFTHGPKNTIFEIPCCLFNFAKEQGLLHDLDWLCKKNSIEKARDINKEFKLFIKSVPLSIHQSSIRMGFMHNLLKEYNIEAQNIVLEISDKNTIINAIAYRKFSELYKGMSKAVVINDSWSDIDIRELLNINISYIKISMDIIRNIDVDPEKRERIKIIQNISKSNKAQIIADGLHNKKELKTLLDLNIEYGQGYLIAHPGPPFPDVNIMEIFIEDEELHKKLLSSIFYKRGIDYFNNSQYDKAILELSKVLEIDNENINGIYYRGYAYFEEGSSIAAEVDISKVLKLDPNHYDAILLFAMINEKVSNKDKAIKAFSEFIERAPDSFHSQKVQAKQRITKLSE